MIDVKKLLTKIINRFGAETFTGTRSNAISRGDCYGIYDKASDTVRINFYFYNTSSIPSSYILFTIPQKYRPKATKYGTAMYVTTGGTSAYQCYIATNGSIYQNLGSTILQGHGTIEYILGS